MNTKLTSFSQTHRAVLTLRPAPWRTWGALMLAALAAVSPALATAKGGAPGLPVGHFVPLATYEVSGVVAEIVDATPDGRTLVYTDSEEGTVGLVDISDPANPVESGKVDVGGQPTSVAILPGGRRALVGVYEGQLVVVNLMTASIDATFELGGQPDCVTISPDGRYAAIAIENERDEDVDDGLMPQDPPGWLAIVDLKGLNPAKWTLREVSLVGVADRFPEDPEPEFVAIRHDNLAAVTLQENNFVVLVDLVSGDIVGGFSAGTTTHAADLVENKEVVFGDLLENARLEPDAIGWTPLGKLVTANEGDYDLDLVDGEFVGGRNFTFFNSAGDLLFDSGAQLEMAAAEAGVYDDKRSDAKGTEPEGIEIARYLNHTYLFVGMERAAAVAVYRLDGFRETPRFVQVLPTGSRPEGLCAIPRRGLFVTANEGDGTISIFAGRPGNP